LATNGDWQGRFPQIEGVLRWVQVEAAAVAAVEPTEIAA
jgi:hypothetical protein